MSSLKPRDQVPRSKGQVKLATMLLGTWYNNETLQPVRLVIYLDKRMVIGII